MRNAILIALVLVGCRQQATPLSNPFLGPDRVPPPGTRTPPPGTALPYYDGTSVPPGLPPTGAMHSQPIEEGANRRFAANSEAEQITVPGDDQRERLVQLASHEDADASAGLPTEPRPFPDIGDLPAVDPSGPQAIKPAALAAVESGRSATDAFRARSDNPRREPFGEVQTASYEAPASPASSYSSPSKARDSRTGRTASPSRKRYAHDPDYAWLQGRLEHSRAADQWKLRYIPIDGQTDQFGGSVVLSNPDELGDLATGDFVRVRGSLLEGKGDVTSFAPLYRIGQIQPLAD